MTLSELMDEVYLLTNRPDLVNETSSAVRRATLKCHQIDYFYKDLFETGVLFSTAAYLQTIDYRALLPNWRAAKYLRKTDSTGTEQGAFFDLIVPENVLDNYSINRQDVYYVAGSVIQIRSSTLLQYAIMGSYVNPNITVPSYSSWIALDQPWAIIYTAAESIFKSIGKSEEFAAFKLLRDEELQTLKLSNITAQGY